METQFPLFSDGCYPFLDLSFLSTLWLKTRHSCRSDWFMERKKKKKTKNPSYGSALLLCKPFRKSLQYYFHSIKIISSVLERTFFCSEGLIKLCSKFTYTYLHVYMKYIYVYRYMKTEICLHMPIYSIVWTAKVCIHSVITLSIVIVYCITVIF